MGFLVAHLQTQNGAGRGYQGTPPTPPRVSPTLSGPLTVDDNDDIITSGGVLGEVGE